MLQQQPSQEQVFARHPSGPEPAPQHLQQPHQSQARTPAISSDSPAPSRLLVVKVARMCLRTWLAQHWSHKACRKERGFAGNACSEFLHAEALWLCVGALLDGLCGLQELPRLPESLLHPEGPMPGISVGSHSFKMPGMDNWNGSPAPWQPPPHQQQSPQPQPQPQPQPAPQPPPQPQLQPLQQQQQPAGFLRDFARPEHFAQHLFPQPQQAPGGGIGPEHMQVHNCLLSASALTEKLVPRLLIVKCSDC